MAGSEFETIERLNDYWDEVVRGEETSPEDLDPALVATVQRIVAMEDAPAADPAFGRRLWRELAGEVALPRSRNRSWWKALLHPVWHRSIAQGRLPVAGLAAAFALALALGAYLALLQPAAVSADEILRKAQEVAASPGASGIKSFVSMERSLSRPGNPRLNAYAGYTGQEESRGETRRWYEAPNLWRVEGDGTVVDPQGKALPNRDWHWVGVSDGKDVWRYDVKANSATVNEIGVDPTGKPESYGSESPLGQGTMDPLTALQASNPNVRPKLQGEEAVAGRRAYVLAFPTGTPSASAPEMNGPRTVWVDKETYFVLKVVQISGTDGKWLSTDEVTSIQYDVAIDPAIFAFSLPRGAKLDDQRPKPAPTKDEFQRQMGDLAREADFPVFLPRELPNGLVPRRPEVRDMLGLQVDYVPPSEADGTSFPTMTVRQQRATSDLVSRWTERAEGVTIGNSKGWLRRGVRNVDGTGSDSAAMLLRDGTLVSVSSMTLSPEELVKVAASLQPVRGGHAPLPNPTVEPKVPRSTPTAVPAPKFTVLRPAWLPEQMAVREQYQADPTGKGSQIEIGFDPRPEDTKPHGVLTLTEMARDAAGNRKITDPEAIRENIGGREVTIIMRGEEWITLLWEQGDVALMLTNPYDPPGHPRYTPNQLRKVVESIR